MEWETLAGGFGGFGGVFVASSTGGKPPGSLIAVEGAASGRPEALILLFRGNKVSGGPVEPSALPLPEFARPRGDIC